MKQLLSDTDYPRLRVLVVPRTQVLKGSQVSDEPAVEIILALPSGLREAIDRTKSDAKVPLISVFIRFGKFWSF